MSDAIEPQQFTDDEDTEIKIEDFKLEPRDMEDEVPANQYKRFQQGCIKFPTT